MLITTSYNLSSVFCNCPSSWLPASWKLWQLLIRIQCNNNNKGNWQECSPHPFPTLEAMEQKKKKLATPPHVPLPHRMNRIRHSYFLCLQFLLLPLLLPHCICTACIDSQLDTVVSVVFRFFKCNILISVLFRFCTSNFGVISY